MTLLHLQLIKCREAMVVTPHFNFRCVTSDILKHLHCALHVGQQYLLLATQITVLSFEQIDLVVEEQPELAFSGQAVSQQTVPHTHNILHSTTRWANSFRMQSPHQHSKNKCWSVRMAKHFLGICRGKTSLSVDTLEWNCLATCVIRFDVSSCSIFELLRFSKEWQQEQRISKQEIARCEIPGMWRRRASTI